MMIQAAVELKHPQIEGASILALQLIPDEGESREDFATRIERLINGVHQMEFKQLTPGVFSLKIALNPQWEIADEVDDLGNVSEAELLREFEQTAAGRHDNKIKY